MLALCPIVCACTLTETSCVVARKSNIACSLQFKVADTLFEKRSCCGNSGYWVHVKSLMISSEERLCWYDRTHPFGTFLNLHGTNCTFVSLSISKSMVAKSGSGLKPVKCCLVKVP